VRRAAVFVLSDARSGSTILDQCLGGHPEIMSLGEVHWLPAYAAQDRSRYDPDHPLVCMCGLAVSECPFWSRVEVVLGRPLAELRLHALSSRSVGASGHRFVDALTLVVGDRCPTAFRSVHIQRVLGGRTLAAECIALFDAVSQVSGRPVCVDSSKSALRFRFVYDSDPDRTRAIVLTRDVRAVVYSKMKRGRSLKSAAMGWKRKMRIIDSLTADLPNDHVHFLSYEALCKNPAFELARLCSFLDVEMCDTMLQRATNDVHHIGGSPSKFDKGRIAIAEDRSFEKNLHMHQADEIARLAGTVAKRWGY